MTEDKLPEKEMTFLDHLEELRNRLIKSLVSIAVGVGVSYIFRDKIFLLISSPLPGKIEHLTTLHPSEAFMVYMTVSLWTGMVLAFPVLVYQIWRFVSPGLYAKEKKIVIPMVFAITFFFLLGVAFCYKIVYPFTLKFFLDYNVGILMATWTAEEYFSFTLRMLFAFGIVFELPFVMALLTCVGVVDVEIFKRNRRVAIVIIFVVAAILTPSDVFSQLMLALPLTLLYEFGILLSKILLLTKSRE